MKTPNPKTTKAQKPKRKPREWIGYVHTFKGQDFPYYIYDNIAEAKKSCLVWTALEVKIIKVKVREVIE